MVNSSQGPVFICGHPRADGVRFIVVLRDPISNVWSMLNYPYETEWHPNSRPEEGYYDRTYIWDNMLRWSQPYWSLASLVGTELWSSIMLVRYDWFTDNVDKALENIFQFVGVEDLPAIAGSLKQNILQGLLLRCGERAGRRGELHQWPAVCGGLHRKAHPRRGSASRDRPCLSPLSRGGASASDGPRL